MKWAFRHGGSLGITLTVLLNAFDLYRRAIKIFLTFFDGKQRITCLKYQVSINPIRAEVLENQDTLGGGSI